MLTERQAQKRARNAKELKNGALWLGIFWGCCSFIFLLCAALTESSNWRQWMGDAIIFFILCVVCLVLAFAFYMRQSYAEDDISFAKLRQLDERMAQAIAIEQRNRHNKQ